MIRKILTTDIDNMKALVDILPIKSNLKSIIGKYDNVFVISIIDKDKHPFLKPYKKIRSVLTVAFNDDNQSFTPDMANKIKTFIDSIKKRYTNTNDLLIIHCTAGASRSGALAVYIANNLGITPPLNICPNPYVLHVLNNF